MAAVLADSTPRTSRVPPEASVAWVMGELWQMRFASEAGRAPCADCSGPKSR